MAGILSWYGSNLLITMLAGGATVGPFSGRTPAADLYSLCDMGHADRDAECLARFK